MRKCCVLTKFQVLKLIILVVDCGMFNGIFYTNFKQDPILHPIIVYE